MGTPGTSADGRADLEIGYRIDRACLQRGWDRGELADRAGVSRTTLYQIGRGAVTKPRASTLKRIADALEVSVESLTAEAFSRQAFSESEQNPAPAFQFDRNTNSVIEEICDDSPRLFLGWSGADWQELYSSFGTGGQLTPEGVRQAADHINRKREAIRRLNIVLETHLHDVAVSFIESLYQSVRPQRHRTKQEDRSQTVEHRNPAGESDA